MKSVFRLLSIVVVLATGFTFMSVQPAAASCVVFRASNPPTTEFEFQTQANHSYVASFKNVNEHDETIGPDPVDSTHLVIVLPGQSVEITDLSADCASGPITTFSPGDARLNGKPGDRLVVYCNAQAAPPNIEVYLIAPGGIGTSLGKLPLADLASGQISKNLGANGTLWAGTNADGVSYIALQGGTYSATGVGDWAKVFTCKA